VRRRRLKRHLGLTFIALAPCRDCSLQDQPRLTTACRPDRALLENRHGPSFISPEPALAGWSGAATQISVEIQETPVWPRPRSCSNRCHWDQAQAPKAARSRGGRWVRRPACMGQVRFSCASAFEFLLALGNGSAPPLISQVMKDGTRGCAAVGKG